MILTGSIEEKVQAAIGFAKAHGGFGSCRLFEYCKPIDPIDLSALKDGKERTDREMAEMVTAALKWYTPGKIEYVVE